MEIRGAKRRVKVRGGDARGAVIGTAASGKCGHGCLAYVSGEHFSFAVLLLLIPDARSLPESGVLLPVPGKHRVFLNSTA
jgi:hypothetical protein